ncbi:PAAR-like domain-containing protein [Labrys neptuniae]
MGRISARQNASNVIVSTGPDVCWTPRGGAMVAVPYTSIAFLDTAVRVSTSIRKNGDYDFQLNSRCAVSEGHEPGVGKGVVVQGYLGPAHVKTASHFLFTQGYATCSHRDPAWINRSDEGAQEPQKGMFGEQL